MKLKDGIYENLINQTAEGSIREAEVIDEICKRNDIDDAESSKMLASYVAQLLRIRLEDMTE